MVKGAVSIRVRQILQVWLPLKMFCHRHGIQAVQNRLADPNHRPDVAIGKDGMRMQVNDQRPVTRRIRELNGTTFISLGNRWLAVGSKLHRIQKG